VPFLIAREAVTRPGRERVPEKMVMDEEEAVLGFDAVGAEGGALLPVYEMGAEGTSRLLRPGGLVFDLGCGTGRYLIHLAKRRPDAHLVGIDLSDGMLDQARENIRAEGLEERIRVAQGDITDFVDQVPERVDLLSCHNAVHHLPTRDDVRRCFTQIAEARRRTGSGCLIFDLARMKHARSHGLLLSVAAEMSPVALHDAVASEAAAWSFGEMRETLAEAGLGDLASVLSKPIKNNQLHWCPPRDGGHEQGHEQWVEIPLPPAQQRAHKLMRKGFDRFPGLA